MIGNPVNKPYFSKQMFKKDYLKFSFYFEDQYDINLNFIFS